ncbi:MAG TPA: hypothetical protein VIS48_11015 [Candidatus Kryptonia bacterium]
MARVYPPGTLYWAQFVAMNMVTVTGTEQTHVQLHPGLVVMFASNVERLANPSGLNICFSPPLGSDINCQNVL